MKIKRLVLMAAAAMMMTAGASAKCYDPQLHVGDSLVYRTVSTNEMEFTPGQKTYQKTTNVNSYAVRSRTADGFVVVMTTHKNDVEITGYLADVIRQQLPPKMNEILGGMTVILSTDTHGRVTGVLNIDDVKKRINAMVSSIDNALVRETLEASLKSFMEPKTLISSNASIGNVLGLSGRDIEPGKDITLSINAIGSFPMVCTMVNPQTIAGGPAISLQTGKITSFTELAQTTMDNLEQLPVFKQLDEKQQQEFLTEMKKKVNEEFGKASMVYTTTYTLYPDFWPESIQSKSDFTGWPSKTSQTLAETTCIFRNK